MTIVVLRGIPRLALHLSEMVEDVQNSGIMIARRQRGEIVLTEGRNEIDDDFWQAWSKQNAKSDLKKFIIEDRKD